MESAVRHGAGAARFVCRTLLDPPINKSYRARRDGSGRIAESVKDASGAVIPGSKVSLVNTAIGFDDLICGVSGTATT